MTDDTPLAENGHRRRDAGEHPEPERLSAYLANELSPAEDDRIQEHVANCEICAEALLDLPTFLDPAPKERKGVADLESAAEWRKLESAAEWRKLRDRLEKEPARKPAEYSPVSFGSFFRSARGGYAAAAALLAVAVALGLWNLSLVRRSREPIVPRTTRTLSAEGSLRGPAEPAEEPVVLPAQITLELPVETPEPRYHLDFVRQGSRVPERSLEVLPQETELRFVLPEKALRPGEHVIKAQGLRDGKPSGDVLTFELTVGSSKP